MRPCGSWPPQVAQFHQVLYGENALVTSISAIPDFSSTEKHLPPMVTSPRAGQATLWVYAGL
jgi:hypothetical protein